MFDKKKSCELTGCFLCRNVLPEWKLAVTTHRKILRFKKNETIFREGEPTTGIYFIVQGTVKVHNEWGFGKELIVRFARSGDIIGHRGLGLDAIYSVTGTALEPVIACFIDLAFFEATLKANTGFLYLFMNFLSDELKLSERRMRNLAHMQVKGRVAAALLYLRKQFGENEQGRLGITVGRADLASYVGTTYETISRTLTDLEGEHLIALEEKEIRVLNLPGLERLGGN